MAVGTLHNIETPDLKPYIVFFPITYNQNVVDGELKVNPFKLRAIAGQNDTTVLSNKNKKC